VSEAQVRHDRSQLAPAVRRHEEGTTVAIRVVVRAPRTQIAGAYGEAVKLKVAAPPVGGAANDEVRAHLAGLLRVRPADVRLLSGERGRDKVVLLTGCAPEEVLDALTR
jgi:uncharacterized protein